MRNLVDVNRYADEEPLKSDGNPHPDDSQRQQAVPPPLRCPMHEMLENVLDAWEHEPDPTIPPDHA